MKKLHIALLGISFLLLTSCKEEVEKPKVIYDSAIKGKKLLKLILLKCHLLICQFKWKERII